MIGATDRYNYGDLLFPLIVQKELSQRLGSDYLFYNFSTKKSDLSKYGGLVTKSIRNIKNINCDVAIIVGGEVLSSSWKATYYHVQHSKFKLILNKILFKIIGEKRAEIYIKSSFGLPREQMFPWLIDKHSVGVSKIIYNTVSGTDFSYVQKNINSFHNILEQADYISVRDQKTLYNLNNQITKTKAQLVPDSAFLMSDLFPVDELENLINDKPESVQKTVVFQIGKSFAKSNEQEIVKQLKLISNEGWHIVLLPIGYATLHEDSIPLKKIYSLLSPTVKNVDIKYGTIFDIMYTIATSDMFIGTSLHGNITALSYGIPSIALDKRVEKLSEFLKSFGIRGQKFGVDYSDIFQAFKETEQIDKRKLIQNSNNLKMTIRENFDVMAKVILREEKSNSVSSKD